MKNRRFKKKGSSQSSFAKLSIFQNQKFKFKKKCPLSGKNAPKIDYKNIRLLKKYTSENGKILSFGKLFWFEFLLNFLCFILIIIKFPF